MDSTMIVIMIFTNYLGGGAVPVMVVPFLLPTRLGTDSILLTIVEQMGRYRPLQNRPRSDATSAVYAEHAFHCRSFTIAPDLRRAICCRVQPSLGDVDARPDLFFIFSSPVFHRGWRAIDAIGVGRGGVSSRFWR